MRPAPVERVTAHAPTLGARHAKRVTFYFKRACFRAELPESDPPWRPATHTGRPPGGATRARHRTRRPPAARRAPPSAQRADDRRHDVSKAAPGPRGNVKVTSVHWHGAAVRSVSPAEPWTAAWSVVTPWSSTDLSHPRATTHLRFVDGARLPHVRTTVPSERSVAKAVGRAIEPTGARLGGRVHLTPPWPIKCTRLLGNVLAPPSCRRRVADWSRHSALSRRSSALLRCTA
jgi:hypothetical protein